MGITAVLNPVTEKFRSNSEAWTQLVTSHTKFFENPDLPGSVEQFLYLAREFFKPLDSLLPQNKLDPLLKFIEENECLSILVQLSKLVFFCVREPPKKTNIFPDKKNDRIVLKE